ncbi:Dabb family protein [Negadavirga shengliensis]|uniref:Dabb family protein n=1 Tax=Negadavirga shengliensis TaxID=1389218 RepID=A0ABV9T2V1_9BACT
MKTFFIYSVSLLLLAGYGCQSRTANQSTDQPQPAMKEVKSEKPLLRHVVLLKFKDESSLEDIKKVEEAFIALKDKIPQIKTFEWGTNNSPEGLNKGLTHCFLVSFESEEDREIYLPHPAHKEFVDVLSPHLDDVTVIDYWPQ